MKSKERRDFRGIPANAMLLPVEIILIIVVLIGLVAAMLAVHRMVKPVRQMTEDIVKCGQNGTYFAMQDRYRTNDEIEILAESFADLSDRTRRYIRDITEITAEKERIGTELALAKRIQADMLPNIFPAFPDRAEFDIYAGMDPAKEVGGDFYDFFLIDNDHLGVVIADVSGKGIPAALFMMGSKILVQNFTMTGMSPAKVLETVNHQICANNREQMFVTVWLGVLELSTGKLTCSNAGHEYPVLKMPDGSFELYHDKHGFVIGGMDGMRYRDYEIQLKPGAKLFVYTDGVPEATNADSELFGVERIAIVERIAVQKRIADRTVPNLVDVLLALAAVARVKIGADLFAAQHCHRQRQPAVERSRQAFTRDRVLRFDADAIHIGVHAGVCTAATLDVKAAADDFCQRVLKSLLHGKGVLLDLPAVKMPAVVANGEQKISYIAVLKRMLHTITPPITSAMTTNATASRRAIRICFIRVLPAPPR